MQGKLGGPFSLTLVFEMAVPHYEGDGGEEGDGRERGDLEIYGEGRRVDPLLRARNGIWPSGALGDISRYS